MKTKLFPGKVGKSSLLTIERFILKAESKGFYLFKESLKYYIVPFLSKDISLGEWPPPGLDLSNGPGFPGLRPASVSDAARKNQWKLDEVNVKNGYFRRFFL